MIRSFIFLVFLKNMVFLQIDIIPPDVEGFGNPESATNKQSAISGEAPFQLRNIFLTA